MHDIRQIRQDSSDFDRQMKRRGLTPNSADILSIDSKKRSAVTELQTLQKKRNKIQSKTSMSSTDKSFDMFWNELAGSSSELEWNPCGHPSRPDDGMMEFITFVQCAQEYNYDQCKRDAFLSVLQALCLSIFYVYSLWKVPAFAIFLISKWVPIGQL